MPSVKAAIPQPEHRERAQPLSRRNRYPLLEKHKDYSLRAADHNAKKRKLRLLREKASERNPDEFRFAMINTDFRSGGKDRGREGTKAPKDGGRGGENLSVDVVKLLKTQDAGYLRTVTQQTRNERQRLEQQLLILERGPQHSEAGRLLALGTQSGGLEVNNPKRHTIFVNNSDEQTSFDMEKHFDISPENVNTAYNRPRRSQNGDSKNKNGSLDGEDENEQHLQSLPAGREKKKSPFEVEKERHAFRAARHASQQKQELQERQISKLEALRRREKELVRAQAILDEQRARLQGSIGGVNKDGIKFKPRERKR